MSRVYVLALAQIAVEEALGLIRRAEVGMEVVPNQRMSCGPASVLLGLAFVEPGVNTLVEGNARSLESRAALHNLVVASLGRRPAEGERTRLEEDRD